MAEENANAVKEAPPAPDWRTRDHVDQTFGEAFVHRQSPYRVLGLRLRPMSFWHAFLLDFLESPFAGYAKKINLGTLYPAARVCGLTYPQMPSRSRFEWHREMHAAWRYGRTFVAELNKFSMYLRDYHSRPNYGRREGGEPIKCPWYFYEVCLQRRFDVELSWSAAWNMPIGEGSWNNAGMLEVNGEKLPLQTFEDRKAAREAGHPVS